MSEFFRYNWDLKGQEATFLVDLQFAEKFDVLGDFTTLIHVTCLPADPEAKSFTKRERSRLDDVQKHCLEILGDFGIFVGSIDVLAQRRLYFYTRDAKLLLALNGYCEKENAFSLACGRVDEPNRQTYYRLLYPDAAKRQGVANAEYLAVMEKRGDDLHAFRRVNLHLRFSGAPGMQAFAVESKSAGFAIGDTRFVSEQKLPHELTIHTVARLDWIMLTAITTNVIALVSRCGGSLDYLDSAYVEKRF